MGKKVIYIAWDEATADAEQVYVGSGVYETKAVNRCERCGEVLTEVVWLTYDQRTNTYTNQTVPDEYNQGAFPFGKTCAKREIAKHTGSRRTPTAGIDRQRED